jgi:hypothetical protein
VGENNYTLAVVQDVVEPKLIFLGTENGLWVTLDEGKTYTRWTSGYPAGVPTMDLVIHPREHDLAIGTFGRALYILDDIRPLREMVKEGTQVLSKVVHIFDAPDAYQVETQDPAGILFPGNAMFQGENRTTSAMISFVINKPESKKDEPKSDDKKSEAKILHVKLTLIYEFFHSPQLLFQHQLRREILSNWEKEKQEVQTFYKILAYFLSYGFIF